MVMASRFHLGVRCLEWSVLGGCGFSWNLFCLGVCVEEGTVFILIKFL